MSHEEWDWPEIYKLSNNLSEFLSRVHGPWAPYKKKNKRPIPRLRTYGRKQLALKILPQVFDNLVVTGTERVDPRLEVMFLICESRGSSGRKDFASALVHALTGKNSLPKWWRVWRKLCGNLPASQFAAPKQDSNAKRLSSTPS